MVWVSMWREIVYRGCRGVVEENFVERSWGQVAWKGIILCA